MPKPSMGVVFWWLASGSILVTAAILKADPSGVGTHTQLGLGECTFLKATAMPCPMCGMTTTFTHMAHFHWFEAIKTQPFGVFLFLVNCVVFVAATLDLFKPGERLRGLYKRLQRAELRWALGLLTGLLLGWAYKIAVFKGWVVL